jgi:hypothetical protein
VYILSLAFVPSALFIACFTRHKLVWFTVRDVNLTSFEQMLLSCTAALSYFLLLFLIFEICKRQKRTYFLVNRSRTCTSLDEMSLWAKGYLRPNGRYRTTPPFGPSLQI